MINISTYTVASNHHVASNSVSTALPAVMPDDGKAEAPKYLNTSDTPHVSILARQLNDAAVRAEARAEHKSDDLLEPIKGNTFFANKALHDVQTPTTNNPELLERARQATGFVNGSDSNPFKDLTRDQLNLIAHDEGGAFTINERRAAWEAMQPAVSPVVSSPKAEPVNGREIMIARLFAGSEPPVALPPATLHNIAQRTSEFLNHDDRALVSDMYAYAQAEGADLSFVDRLVRALGHYRNYSDGRQFGSVNIGHYDADRYKVSYDFKPEDSAIASRVLNGSAISSTRIDQGFVRYILDPGHGAFMNVGGIPFLERMVNKFSSEGADQPPLGSEFATLKRGSIEDHIVRTVHKDIRLASSTELVQLVNGVLTLTEEGRAAGYSLDKTTGDLRPPAPGPGIRAAQTADDELPAHRVKFRSLVDVIANTRSPLAMLPKSASSLFQALRNYRP